MLPAPSISIPMPRLFLELSLHSLYKFLHNLPIGCRLKWRKGGTSDTYRTTSSHIFWQPIQFITFFLTILLLFYSRRNLLMSLFCCYYFSNITHLCCNWNLLKRNWISFTFNENMTCDISWTTAVGCVEGCHSLPTSPPAFIIIFMFYSRRNLLTSLSFTRATSTTAVNSTGTDVLSSIGQRSLFLLPPAAVWLVADLLLSFFCSKDHFLDHHLENLPVSRGNLLNSWPPSPTYSQSFFCDTIPPFLLNKF